MTSEEELRAKLIALAAKARMPMAGLDPTSPWMPDIDMAVSEALKRIQTSENAEQAGVIFRNPQGQYAYSIPLTMRSRDDFALQAQPTDEHQIAAIWHTHPHDAGGDSEFFSPNDIEMAKKLAVPSYIQFLSNNALRSFTPGKTRTTTKRIAGSMTPIRVSRGDDVVLVPKTLFAESTPQ